MKEIEHHGAGVVFLQETHLFHEPNLELYYQQFPKWYYSDSMTNMAKGVAITIGRGIRFSLEDRLTDPVGRFLFLKRKLLGIGCTLANIYCPNRGPTGYLGEVLGRLSEFKKGKVIIARDLNFCMDLKQQDSTSLVQGTRNAQLKQKLHHYQLVDVFKMQHPRTQD